MTTTKQYNSPIDGKPIETPDKVLEAWYHAFRMWYANLIIARAETPSTLSEINNCRHCQGTNLLHHCLSTTCGPDARTEECLHPSEEEWKEFQELCRKYRIKIQEAKLVISMQSSGLMKYPKFPVGGV